MAVTANKPNIVSGLIVVEPVTPLFPLVVGPTGQEARNAIIILHLSSL
jgi:hypothetical protein